MLRPSDFFSTRMRHGVSDASFSLRTRASASWWRSPADSLSAMAASVSNRLRPHFGQIAGFARHHWRNLSLARQFAIASGLVILILMSAIGSWVAKKIEDGVTDTAGAAAALYMDAFIAPHVRAMISEGKLTPAIKNALDDIMRSAEIKESIASIKIWRPSGVIAYSSIEEHIGKQYAPTSNLTRAWGGSVSTEVDGHSHEDDHLESQLGGYMMEIYAPIRELGTNRIIAVSEFYMRADSLQDALHTAKLQSWGVVGGFASALLLALSVLVGRGSRTIDVQQRALRQRARQNAELSRRIERAYWRADKLNEQFLRRVGADLHDGPAQYMGFALLSLDDIPLDERQLDAQGKDPTLETIRVALQDAIKEIRSLSRGLILPQLDTMSLNEAVHMLVRNHKERTGTLVDLTLPDERIDPPKAYKVCAYRFIQEALNNAFRHAGGRGQSVHVAHRDGTLEITVKDAGSGQAVPIPKNRSNQLGLVGIKDRVETLSGTFEMTARPEGGLALRIVLDTSKVVELED